MLRIENRILRQIADDATMQDMAYHLCQGVEALLPGVICTVMDADPGGFLDPIAAPSLPPNVLVALRGVNPESNQSKCRLCLSRQRLSVSDICQDPNWSSVREPALASGLVMCWSVPIAGTDGEVVGIVALFTREQRGPLQHEQAIIAQSLDLCEIALRRLRRAADHERRASIDGLTGLPNRAAFNRALDSMRCDEPGAWALFVVDLDNLKVVNDTFGHAAGDALIRIASQRIAAAVAPDMTFRLGGDEFCVLLQRRDVLVDLEGAAGRILAAIEAAADCNGHSVVPSATIGGAVFAAKDLAADVYQNADFALYHAKETGRGGFVRYWPGIGSRMNHRRHAIQDVKAAITEGRIQVYYQPVVRLDTREIIGVEALCRLQTPAGTMVAACEFEEAIADAEIASGLTNQILTTVARDARTWNEAGIRFGQLCVNVSTADFYTGDLLAKLEQKFGEAGVALDHLHIEVKENVSVGRRDMVIAREIARLRRNGVGVALDDFGTGHASLTHLVSMPVDAIKIDRSFVARLGPKEPAMAIVQGLIDIARKLDIRVVAEGIETEHQAGQLWAMGCVFGQGFAFSRAVDRVAMTALLRRHAQGIEGATPLAADTTTVPARSLLQVWDHLRTGTR